MAIEPIKGMYVHDEVTDTDGIAKYDAGALENLDRSLTERYRAPDSKAVGDRLSAVEAVADEANRIAERLNEGGLELKDDVLAENISAWLNEHPEATTTVEDGALTQSKLSNSLDARKPSFYSTVSEMQEDEQLRLGTTAISDGAVYTVRSAVEVNDPEDMVDPSVLYKYDGQYYHGGLTESDRQVATGYECVNGFALFVAEYKNAYVIPEQFGAVGDGVTDDATSIQSCIDYAKENGFTVILCGKDYKCGSALRVGKVTVVGSGKDGKNTILRFSGSDGVIINNRGVFLQNLRIIQNTDGEGVGVDFDTGNDGTIPDVYFNNVTITHFEYGLRASKSVSWSNKFDNVRLQFNKNALYFDSFAGNLSATQFCNEFNNLLIVGVNGGKSLYVRGAMCIFNNANISCTSDFCVDVTSSFVQFNNCSFENDAPITNNAPMISAGQYVTFNNCRFFHNYTTDGNNYFIYSQANTDLHLSFINCHEKAYTGSKLTSLVYPGFGVSKKYGSVYESGNSFSIFDTVYNNYKPYIQRAGAPISLFSNSLDLSKTKEKTLYDYHDETTGKRALVYVSGGQLYDFKTNKVYGTIAEKTTFAPETGTDDGCYYEVVDNYLVHIHIAITGLTANTAQAVYVMPSGLRPKENLPITYYNGNGTPSQYSSMAYGQITTGGTILKYALNGMYADIYYCLT